MIKKIISLILMIAVVIGGAVAADMMKSSAASDASKDSHGDAKAKLKDKHGEAKDKHGKSKPKKSKDKKKKDAKGKGKGGHGAASADGTQYLKFKRQFVVPVLKSGKIDALVIMNLNYVLDSHAPDNVYSYEPKLRDAIMREMLEASNRGMFSEDFTSAENYENIRAILLRTGQSVVADGIEDVLILDIARQDQ